MERYRDSASPTVMRILLIAPQPFFAQRGTPINVRQMVQTLSEAGHEVHLATYPMGEAVEMPNLIIHRAWPIPGVRTVPIGFSWRKVALDAMLALRVWALLAGRRFNVVHAVEESVFFALPPARLRGIPVIYDLDSWLSDQLAYGGRVKSPAVLKLLRRMERSALRRSRLAITVSASLSDAVRAMHPGMLVAQIEDSPIEEALRAPDPARVTSLRERFGIGARPAIVYTGNLESYQGIELLLPAFARSRACAPNAVLVLVGGSPAQIESRALASRGARDRCGSRGAHRPAPCGGDVRVDGDGNHARVAATARRQHAAQALLVHVVRSPDRGDESADAHAGARLAIRRAVRARRRCDGERNRRRCSMIPRASHRWREARARIARDYSREAFRRKLLRGLRDFRAGRTLERRQRACSHA